MGFLDSVKGLFAPQRSLVPVPTSAPPPVESEAVPGYGNFSGRIVGPEPTAELRDVAGYGRAGTYEAGQWALLALSNPYVTMGLDHVLRPVADARVDVEPPPASVIGTGKGRISQADADMHTAFVRWMLTEHFPLGRLNKTAGGGALLSGFSLFEPLAHETDCPAVPHPVWALKDAVQCLPNSLDPSQPWPVDAHGRLVGVGQMGPVGGSSRWVRTVLPVDRALLFSWKREAGNFAGQSQLRSVWYVGGKVMPQLLKMIGVTLQKEGPGWPQAVADPTAKDLTPGQRDDLIELMANMRAHEAAGIVMPKGWEIEWSFSPVSNKGHILAVIERMGLWILQQFGAQQLVIGTGEVGSRSAGETHSAHSMAMVKEVLTFLASVYNGERGEADGLIKRFIIYNWGPQPAYPKVKLTPQRPELGPAELAASAKSAKEAGLFTPTIKDENSYRERAGFSPITKEELEEERKAAAARAPQFAPPGQPPPPPGAPKKDAEEDPEGEPKSEETKVPDEKPLKASAQRALWTPWRPLTAAEEKMNLPALDAYFTAQRDIFENEAKLRALGMLAKATPSIHAAMADGKVTPAEVAAIPLDSTRLKAYLADFVRAQREAGKRSVRAEVESSRPLTAAEEEQDDRSITEEADEVTSAQVEALERKVLNRFRGELEREAVDALRTGDTAAGVVERVIARQLDTGAFRSDAGYVVTKAFNVGRGEAARIMGGIASVTYSAILDSATCDACRGDDGKTAAFNSAEHDALLPPNRDCSGGDNCRCLLIMNPGSAPEGDDE